MPKVPIYCKRCDKRLPDIQDEFAYAYLYTICEECAEITKGCPCSLFDELENHCQGCKKGVE
jgi:flavoprotein